MARLNGAPGGPRFPRAALSPVRVMFMLALLLTIAGGAMYLVSMPLRQLYWGVYDRVRPMMSERNLLRQAKEFPDVEATLRKTIEMKLEAEETSSVDRRLDTFEKKKTRLQRDENLANGAISSASKWRKKWNGEQRYSEKTGAQRGTGPLVEPIQHEINQEFVGKVVKDNTIVVTWANYHYHDFVMNWVDHLRATGCDAYIVGAMDKELFDFLRSKEVYTFSMASGLTTGDFGWGTPTFHKMGREKINLVYAFTKMGFDVLISDVDTVWLRNPLPYMRKYLDADILMSSDHLSTTVADEGLEKWPEAGSAANIGIMLFRPRALELAAEWVKILSKDTSMWDQNAFNTLFRRGSKPLPERDDRLFECYDGKLKCGILPVSIFCSGHTGFIQRMPEKLGLQPYVVHATFQFSGTPGKRHRMRERLWWNDPVEYFSHPEGFITFDDTVPIMLFEAAKKVQRNFTLQSTSPHFRLINHQLKQMRAAFAIAQITGRAVILPRLKCGMDRWWAPHDGTIPGSALELPYLCPADHVLDLETMLTVMDEKRYGPNIHFREYSFLQHPQAAVLNASVLVLEVCQDALQEHCTDGSDSGTATEKLKPHLNEDQLKGILRRVKIAEAKVLRIVGGIERLFDGWADLAAAERFKRRLDSYGAIWCCVNGHPGHIWYDFFFDHLPHHDRHGRFIGKPWEPVTGP